MTDEELKAIEERAAAATEGPWDGTGYDNDTGPNDDGFSAWKTVVAGDHTVAKLPEKRWKWEGPDLSGADAAFIAAARQDVPELVKELRAAREVLGRVEWGTEGDHCPSCGAGVSHRTDCALAAVLGR